MDRRIDQAALQAEESAATKLNHLIIKYKNTAQEPQLLMRLAQVYQESTSIEFRITYARSHQNKNEPNLTKYHSLLQSQINTLDIIIKKYPHYSSMDQVWFNKGKSYEELENVPLAKAAYLTLVQNYPDSTSVMPAYMALADQAVHRNQHPEAISYLNKVESSPRSPYFPIALYKLAWSYYNIKDNRLALKAIQNHVKYYDELKKTQKKFTSSDQAIRENSLMDSVVFFLDANENQPKDYPTNSALDFFNHLESGPLIGRMYVRFTKLLRSHRRDEDLTQWKNLLLQKEKARPEMIEILTLILEHQLNQNEYNQAAQTLSDFDKLDQTYHYAFQNHDSIQLARKNLSDQATLLQGRIQPLAQETLTLIQLKTLSALYQLLIKILPESDLRLGQSHYNLAEIYFRIKSFSEASENYNWILSHWQINPALNKNTTQLKRIASRYEELRNAHLIPLHLEAVSLDSKKKGDRTLQLPETAKEWISWIDELSNQTAHLDESLNNFEFEANRLIYVKANPNFATERLIRFSTSHSQSKFAIASATLAIDTLIQSSDWQETQRLANQLSESHWKDPAFSKRLKEVAADSAFKIAELSFTSKDYLTAIKAATHLAEIDPHNPRAADALSLVAQSYLQLNQKENAKLVFHQLIQSYPNSKQQSIALLNHGQIAEENYHFKEAIEDYKTYLSKIGTSTPKPTDEKVQRRLLLLQWIMADPKPYCLFASSEECQKYQALTLLTRELKPNSISDEALEVDYQLAIKGPKANRALWAALTLKANSALQLRQELNLIKILCQGWEGLDPLTQLALLPSLSTLLPKAFASSRAKLKLEVPLKKASTQTVTRRAEWIREVELSISKALTLPWSRIQASGLHEISGIYSDFINSLTSLPIPKELSPSEVSEYKKTIEELTKPFSSKSKELAEKAYQIASRSSIEDDSLIPIQKEVPELLKKDTLALKKELQSWDFQSKEISLDIKLLKIVNPKFNPNPLTQLWINSYNSKDWPGCSYFMQELETQKTLTQPELKCIQAMLLSASGAKAEGLIEIQSVIGTVEGQKQIDLEKVALSHFVHSRSVEPSLNLSQKLNSQRRNP